MESDDEDRSLLICGAVLFLAIGRIVLSQSSGPSSSPRTPLTVKMKAPRPFEHRELLTRRHGVTSQKIRMFRNAAAACFPVLPSFDPFFEELRAP